MGDTVDFLAAEIPGVQGNVRSGLIRMRQNHLADLDAVSGFAFRVEGLFLVTRLGLQRADETRLADAPLANQDELRLVLRFGFFFLGEAPEIGEDLLRSAFDQLGVGVRERIAGDV